MSVVSSLLARERLLPKALQQLQPQRGLLPAQGLWKVEGEGGLESGHQREAGAELDWALQARRGEAAQMGARGSLTSPCADITVCGHHHAGTAAPSPSRPAQPKVRGVHRVRPSWGAPGVFLDVLKATRDQRPESCPAGAPLTPSLAPRLAKAPCRVAPVPASSCSGWRHPRVLLEGGQTLFLDVARPGRSSSTSSLSAHYRHLHFGSSRPAVCSGLGNTETPETGLSHRDSRTARLRQIPTHKNRSANTVFPAPGPTNGQPAGLGRHQPYLPATPVLSTASGTRWDLLGFPGPVCVCGFFSA